MARHGRQNTGAAERTFAQNLRRQQVTRLALCAALLVVMAVPPVFVNHPIGYIPIITFALILLICWTYLRVIARAFAVEHEFDENSCTRETSVELPIVLKNRSRLPILRARPRVYVKNPYGVVEREVLGVAMIDGRGDDRMNVKVQLGHVGVYTAGLQGVVLHDPLMFFSVFVSVEEETTLVSTPKDYVASAVELADMATHESRTPMRVILSDNVDYAGTRGYEYGDPMKSVHWKLSARTGDLQTRLFEASVNMKLSVVMDFHAPGYEPNELLECNDVIVEAALAVMRLALRRKVETTLCYVGKDGAPVSRGLPNASGKEQFVLNLPLLSPEVDAQAALDLADNEVARFGGSDSIVFCTCMLSGEFATRAAEIRGGHRSVTVLVAVPRGSERKFYQDNQGVLSELTNAGVQCAVFSDASDFDWAADRG